MKIKLIILNTSQFGSLTDSYKWCEYLRENYEITFLCFDNHWKKMDLDGVRYKYIHRFNNSAFRGLWYILYALIYCLFHLAPVFIVYFKHCEIFPILLPFRKFHVDIRTLAISEDESNNKKIDNEMRKSLSHFSSISFISKGVKDKLNVESGKQYILPLGSDVISGSMKNWEDIHLLYVGTLYHRDIYKTVEGLSSYISSYGDNQITYDIVGDGPEIESLISIVNSKGLQNQIFLRGRVPYDELKPYFDRCNVGVSFVPIEDCYQYQPPTKTFEYILSGLFCIATNTIANKEVINEGNGILIQDSKEDFSNALNIIKRNMSKYNSKEIRSTLYTEYSWKSIVNNSFIPILDNL